MFAHGLWADGSCYNKVIPALLAEGHEVVSAQNCLDTVQGDVAAVHRALGQVSSPAILVGHSYGGTVITAALERFVAKRMRATVTELDSSHVPMLSQPDRVIEVILAAASSIAGAKTAAA